MRRVRGKNSGTILLLALLTACVGGAQSLQGSGSLLFPPHQLNGAPVELSGSSAPIYQIDWLGSFPELQLTLVASPLLSAGNQSLPAQLLSFTSQGASFVTLEGDPLDAFQVESLSTATLETPMLVLSVPAGVQGRWRYLPRASNFRMQIPAEAYAGVYQGEITATITGGP